MNTFSDVLIGWEWTTETEARRNRKLLANEYLPNKGYF